MLKSDEVLELRRKALESIANLKTMKEDFVSLKEYQLAKSTQEKITRYYRDIKIIEIVLADDLLTPNVGGD